MLYSGQNSELETQPSGFSDLMADERFAVLDFTPEETHTTALTTEEDRQRVRDQFDVLSVHLLEQINFQFCARPSNEDLRNSLQAWGNENMVPLCGDDEETHYKVKVIAAATQATPAMAG